MPSKKKTKTRKSAKPAKKARKRIIKSKPARKSAKKKISPRGKSNSKKTKTRAKARTRKKKSFVSAETELKREFKNQNLATTGIVSPRQTEDFAGLSREEEADAESVEELVEEGNIFEAGAVAGVQEADDEDEREVHTHEVPEDDVPKEYLDED